jgi:hypothetical protein
MINILLQMFLPRNLDLISFNGEIGAKNTPSNSPAIATMAEVATSVT